MITLRYHIITLVAVFLSLGLGIILGGSIGQNWINEKQQTLLVGLEDKYGEAVKSNNMLQKQIQELSLRIEQSNEEFSTLVSKGYHTNLRGKKLGLWVQEGIQAEPLIQLLTSVGVETVLLTEPLPHPIPSHPILLIGESDPSWIHQLPEGSWLQLKQATLRPSEQWELLKSIQDLYKETSRYEY